jgi:voltage-gated potassium channel
MAKYRIIIFGCNSLSSAVALSLKNLSQELLIVAQDKECIESLNSQGFNTRTIDYNNDAELRDLGIGEHVEIIFTFFNDDARNVFLTISAREIAPDLNIISLTQSKDSSHKLFAAGATKVIDPYEISGRKVYDLIKRPLIAETIEKVVFGDADLNLAELRIVKGSFLDGNRLGELALSRNYDLIVLGAIDRELSDDFIFACSGMDHKLDQDDILVVIGKADEINRLKQEALQPTTKD